jgi:hypothetical protein
VPLIIREVTRRAICQHEVQSRVNGLFVDIISSVLKVWTEEKGGLQISNSLKIQPGTAVNRRSFSLDFELELTTASRTELRMLYVADSRFLTGFSLHA